MEPSLPWARNGVDNPTPTPEQTRIKLPIDPGSVRDATCKGAQITVLVALVIALYFIIRNLAVSGIRKVWKPDDVAGFHRQRERKL